jgi:hypothetical protein
VPASITPMLHALAAGGAGHHHADGSECPGDAALALANLAAAGSGTRMVP